jgi:hypothetical protein
MKIPSRGTVGFVKQIRDQCSASRNERLQRGAMYRNLFLTGDEDGNSAIYNKTFAFIDNVASYLFSPVELRYKIEIYGSPTAYDRAMNYAASSELNKYLRQGNVDTCIEQAVNWALVKGKTFIKLLWSEEGFEPYLIQPEYMGVLREDIEQLDRQEAFFQSSYYTYDRFRELIDNYPEDEKKDILRKVQKYLEPSKGGDMPDRANKMKQVILGDLYPYQQSGNQNNANQNRGVVAWLGGPFPTLSPDLLESLVRMDEVWIWDDVRDDYTTFQLVGDDILLTGKDTHRNIFADMYDPDNKEKSLKSDSDNPLSGKHPFIEICPNPLDGYFWGRSELINVALLQKCISTRINGINSLLRRQEDPPRYFRRGTGMKQTEYSKLNKPGGYLVDTDQSAKEVQTLAPELPEGLFASLHEYEKMFDDMSGMAPVLQGRGESGVRAQGHAETLVRTASPRFKDRALLIERQAEAVGGLALDILKAKLAHRLTSWLMPKDQTLLDKILSVAGINPKGIEDKLAPDADLELPPVQGMKPMQFMMYQVNKNSKVVVDSHSSSPAFSNDTRSLLFELFKAGAITLEQLVMHTNPPGADTIIEDIRKAEIEKQAFAEQHPEAVIEAQNKKKKK